MFMSHHQTTGQIHYITVANKSFENVAKFIYFGMTLTNRNSILHNEIKSRINSRNTCYIAVQNLLSSLRLSANVKSKVHKTIILPVSYRCETWSLTLREEQRLRVFENRVLTRIIGPKRDEVTGGWRKLHMRGFHSLYFSPNIIRMIISKTIRCAEHIAYMEKMRNA
jgi:hypothetical protein